MAEHDHYYKDIEIDSVLERFGYNRLHECVKIINSYYKGDAFFLSELDALRAFYNNICGILGHELQIFDKTVNEEVK